MSESLSGFPLLKSGKSSLQTLTNSSKDIAKVATFHGLGASITSFPFEPFFYMNLQLHSA